MRSAFGVEHGDIEKAFGFSALGSAMGRGVSSMSKPLGRGANKLDPKKGRLSQMGQTAGIKAGQGAKRFGQAMQRRPGLTGGLTAGTGAAGVGGAGGMFMNRRRQ